MTGKMLAFHFDLKRPMWRRDSMHTMVGRLKEWGFNTILYEIEDKLKFKNHPAISHKDVWSQEETSDFVAECCSLAVEVIPLMQSLAHAECVVGKPQYAHLREEANVTDQYDPLSDEARALILELFDQIIEVFEPREFFHVGGDKAWHLGKSEKCRPLIEKIGVGGLYLRQMLPIFEHLNERGLRPMLWDDMILKYPDIIQQIPRDVVMVNWD
jgi:hypothetical protein